MEACSRILFFAVLCMRRDSEDSRSNLYLLRDLCYCKTESWRIVSVNLNNQCIICAIQFITIGRDSLFLISAFCCAPLNVPNLFGHSSPLLQEKMRPNSEVGLKLKSTPRS
jgi:hypothetical protein